jgi:hypothetical protein
LDLVDFDSSQFASELFAEAEYVAVVHVFSLSKMSNE